jgi:hydroxyacylglutathione hydrolase
VTTTRPIESTPPNGLPQAARPWVIDFLAPGLGDRSYLVVSGESAVMIDPQRDVDPYLEAAERAGARITHVLETHIHNDYVSGGLELSRRAGAQLVLPSRSGATYGHLPAADEDRFETGRIHIRSLSTPGHTLDHTSYLIDSEDGQGLLFSGGSLLAGSAGRPDLMGAAYTDRLVAHQFASVRRLAALDPGTILYPTHGAGSFCTASGTRSGAFSTIGQEVGSNPALLDTELLPFRERQLTGLLRYPAYYPHMAPINRSGPAPLGRPVAPPRLSPAGLASLAGAGVHVVDGRSRAAFAAGHIPGALNVELSDDFGTYVGWLLPFDAPIALVLDPAQDVVEAVRQLARIGFDSVRGVLLGLAAWIAEGRGLEGFRRATVEQLRTAIAREEAPRVLDVRQPDEWRGGIIAGSIPRFVADLAEPDTWLPPGGPVWVVCASGFRASIASSLLAAAGREVIAVDGGGVPDVVRAG